MSKQQHHRWTERQARQELARAEEQGLTIAELAQELGVSPQRLYWWRSRLKQTAPAPAGFVEVALAPPHSSHQPFTVHTAGGRRIEVWPGFDAPELSRLVAALEGARC